jgi:hypothetical protein
MKRVTVPSVCGRTARDLSRLDWLLAGLLSLGLLQRVGARSFRDDPNYLPNGEVFGCQNCHDNPNPVQGNWGPLNPFGLAVNSSVGQSTLGFWSANMASMDSDGDGYTNGEELGDSDGNFVPTPGAQITNPGDALSTPFIPPPVLNPEMLVDGIVVTVSWSGGQAPFLVQKRATLSGAWMDLLTTASSSAPLAASGRSGFLRVRSDATNTVLALTVWLTGAAEIPPVNTPATGFGTLALDENNRLTYQIPYGELLANPTSANIHGPANSTQIAGFLVPNLQGASGRSGELAGSVTISSGTRSFILGGRSFINILTSGQSGGEIRGQIARMYYQATLTGAAEVPAVSTPGTGSATFILLGNQISWTVSYQNLSTAATQAHIHGPASTTTNAPPIVTLSGVSGTSGTITGSARLSAPQLGALVDGMTYVNIHTTANSGGEIRGQITAVP